MTTGTMNIQDDGKAPINSGQLDIPDPEKEGDQSNLGSSEIRKIKLNYIQMNKRATTANTGATRKIPQKQGAQQPAANEYQAKAQSGTATSGFQQTATGFNVYEDKPTVANQAVARNTMTNFAPASAADPNRQLQNRQTRRLVTPATGTR